MEFYYCEDYGAIFMKEDITVVCEEEPQPWVDGCPVEKIYEWHCPECGSSDVNECEYCEDCGEPFAPGDLVDGVCVNCRDAEEILRNSFPLPLDKDAFADALLENMKNIASLFDRYDEKNPSTMITMYISQKYIDVTAFDTGEKLYRHFNLVYNRETAKAVCME